MTQTLAVATGTATPAAAPGGAVTEGGASGLFGLLMGLFPSAGGELIGATGTGGALPLPLQGTAGITVDALVQQALVQLGDGPALEVQGDADTLNVFSAHVQQMYQMLVQGGLSLDKAGDAKELAGALTRLGMDAETATNLAGRIETMLKLVEQQHQAALDGETAGTLATMMLATLLPQQGVLPQPDVADAAGRDGQDALAGVQLAGVQLQIASVTTVTVAQAFQGIKVFAGTGPSSAADVGRALVAGEGVEGVLAEASGAAGAAGVSGFKVASGVVGLAAQVPGDDKGNRLTDDVAKDAEAGPGSDLPAVSSSAASAAGASAGRELTVSVHHSSGRDDARVAVALPQSVSDVSLSQAQAVAPAMAENVPVERVLDKPRGDVVYKWQADAVGTETLQAVQPQNASQDAGLNMQAQQMQALLAAGEAATDAPGETTAFADKLADRIAVARQADAASQVALQMKPLLDQGGGTIRMTVNPPELGQVQIDLTIAEGKVHGTIAASQPAVVEQLARDLHSLRQGLADAGLKLGDQGINLMLSDNNTGGQGGHQQGQQQAMEQRGQSSSGSGFAGGWQGNGFDGADGVEAELPGEWISPDRVVDMRV